MKTLEATSASEPIVPHAVHADAVLKSLASDRAGGLTAAEVADAINDAPAGRVIAASEEKVRDLLETFRQKAYEMNPPSRSGQTR